MTRVYEEREEVVTRQYWIKTLCDWCGVTIENPHGYAIRSFELEHSKGYAYPDNGSQSGWRVEDLCDTCAAKLRRLLEENGIKVVEFTDDW